MYEWLASTVDRHERAWDCGSGSGQAAVALASRFREVVATDASALQLANAPRERSVLYAVMRAELAALGRASVDLVTVAQALHWFDVDQFFAEADRVLRPGGLLAIWSYGLHSISPAVDALLGPFYHDILGPYWPVERALVETGYADIRLPYPELTTPTFAMTATWNLQQLAGYVSTWSAVSRYRAAAGTDPVPPLMHEMALVWGPRDARPIRWPLLLRAACKPM